MKRNILILSILFFAPLCLHAAKEVSYLPSISIEDKQVAKKGRDVELTMTVDLSELRIKTQHTVALVPVLVSRDGSKEVSFPSVVIDGRTRNKIYLRSLKMKTVELPAYHANDSIAPSDTILRRKNRSEQSYAYSASVPYKRWMLDGRVEIREYVHGCVNCGQGESSAPMLASVLPDYKPSYSYAAIEPAPEPVKIREKSNSAYLQFKVDKYDILTDYKTNSSELETIRKSIEVVRNDRDLEIIGIYIMGYASPEATVAHNKQLSSNRAKALANYIIETEGIDSTLVHHEGKGENWSGLTEEMKQNADFPQSEGILRIIADADSNYTDNTESLIKKLGGVYRQLLTEVYPKLRRSDYRIEYNVRNFDLEEARRLLHERPELLSLSEIYKVAGSYEKYSEQYEDAMAVAAKMYPNEPSVVSDRANDAMARGDYEAAVEMLESFGVESNPLLLNNLGVAYAGSGKAEQARDAFNRASENGCEEAGHNLDEVEKVIDLFE